VSKKRYINLFNVSFSDTYETTIRKMGQGKRSSRMRASAALGNGPKNISLSKRVTGSQAQRMWNQLPTTLFEGGTRLCAKPRATLTCLRRLSLPWAHLASHAFACLEVFNISLSSASGHTFGALNGYNQHTIIPHGANLTSVEVMTRVMCAKVHSCLMNFFLKISSLD